MNINEICIRDPYILPHKGVYYMYGKINPTNFCVYKSRDLKEWSEPETVFEKKSRFLGRQRFLGTGSA